MFTEKQMPDLFERVLQAMLKAGWLQSFIFTEGMGWRLVWFPEGKGKAEWLKLVVVDNDLSSDDRAPISFDILAHGGSLGVDVIGELETDTANRWCRLIDELGLHKESDALLVLAQIVMGWG